MEREKQTYDLIISDLGSEGEGIAKKNGKAVFVKWALKGERVRVMSIKTLTHFDIARLCEIVRPSPDRVEPPCPLFRRCGGCQLQHMTYAAQLDFKKDLVKNALYKYAGITAEVKETVPSPAAHRYRNKLSVPVRAGRDGGADIGFFESNSHRVVPLHDCLLQPEWNGTLLHLLRRFLAESGVEPFDERTGGGIVRHLTCRALGGHLSVAAVVTRREERLKRFFTLLAGAFSSVTLYENINRAQTNVILGETWRVVGTNAQLKAPPLTPHPPAPLTPQPPAPLAPHHPAPFVPHPAAFYQVNDAIAEALYRAAETALPDGGILIDAYSGGGRLTRRLARKAKTAYGIELSKAAHEDALGLKKSENAANMHPVQGDCAVVLPGLLEKFRGEPVSVLLDPPRKGCPPAVTDALCRYQNAHTVVYISCNPATLARDVKRLSGAFTLVSTQPYDMFPQTAEVETLCVLKRSGVTS